MKYVLLLLISCIWGGQFSLIKISLTAFSPDYLAFLRTLFAAIFLLLVSIIFKTVWKKRSFHDWVKVLLISVFEVAIPFTLIMWGQQHLSSSMTAVIIGSIPIFTLMLVMLLKMEPLTVDKFLTMIIGFVGLIILVSPDTSTLNGVLLPKIAILLGALSFATALVIINSMPNEGSLLLSRDTFIMGSIILCLCNYENVNKVTLILESPLKALASSMILGVICSGLVYVMYVLLIKKAGASFCSLSNYLVPLFGTIFGVMFMNESITLQMFVGAAFITLSLVIKPIIEQIQKRIQPPLT